MFSPLFVIAAMCLYIGLLFVLAHFVERTGSGRRIANHPFTYALALSVYCTTWTYYGSVGRSASGGMGYLPVYLGPTLALLVGGAVFQRIAELKHAHRITSIADFISARFGKSQAVAALVTGLLTIGIIPYLALQLRAASQTFAMLVAGGSGEHSILSHSFGPISVCLMIVFTIVFGIRHLDPTERHPGMLASLAVEAFVKLSAFLAAGGFVIGAAFHGYAGFERALAAIEPGTLPLMGRSSSSDSLTYVTVLLLSMAAFAFLPRQFHVGIVENNRPADVRTVQWLTPLYLLLINLFVVPLALGGKLLTASGTSPDFYVLAAPLQAGRAGLSLAVFLGGFSAAIGMVMIESLTMATMISNHLLVPAAQHIGGLGFLRRYVLFLRWIAAAFFILGGYLFSIRIGGSYPLVAIGLISFAAAALLAPVILLGLYWRGANRAGALIGIGAGGAVWFYTLMLPTFVKAGWGPSSWLSAGPLGLSLLRPEALLGAAGLPSLVHGAIWSLAATLLGLIAGSVSFRASPEELSLREAFLGDPRAELDQLDASSASIDVAQQLTRLRAVLSDYFASPEVERLLARALGQADCRGQARITPAQCGAFLFEVEHTLAGALGSASAHALMRGLLPFERKHTVDLQREYASVFAQLRLSPSAIKSRIDAQDARERLLEDEIRDRDEQLVAKSRESSLLLEQMVSGLLTVDRDLIVQPGYSRSCHTLLDTEHIAGRHLGDILRLGSELRQEYAAGVQQAFDEQRPDALALSRLPQGFQSMGGRPLLIQPRMLRAGSGDVLGLLLCISDVSELQQAERDLRDSRALLGILQLKPAFELFLADTRDQLRKARSRAASDVGFVRRVLNFIKENAALYGISALSELIAEIEAQPRISGADLDAVAAAFRDYLSSHALLGIGFDQSAEPVFTLTREQAEQLRAAVRAPGSGADGSLDALLQDLESVPARDLLGPLEQLVAVLAERSGKKVALELHGREVRVDRSRMAPLFQLLPLLIRNAIEHGIEVAEARRSKPKVARLLVEVLEDDRYYSLAVQDDGRGIDASAVLAAAVSKGVLPEAQASSLSEPDVLRLVLRERVSTAAVVTDISGRGFGLAAVHAEARRWGGEVAIQTEPGRSTRIEVTVPKAARPAAQRPSERPALRARSSPA